MIVRQDEQVDELFSREEITLYMSLGFALKDLCAVELVWQTLENQQDGGE